MAKLPHVFLLRPIHKTRLACLVASLLALTGCGDKKDWRPAAIAEAEQEIRTRLGDPAAQFSNVQMTGDSTTGQTCGFVTAKPAAAAQGGTGRFIVYISHDAGPFFESSVGISGLAQAQFDFQWQYDCLNEGYKP